MMWVLIVNLTVMTVVGSPPKVETREVSALQIKDRVFLRQDACESAKYDLLYDDMKAGRPKLDLECRRMGVVE